MAIYNNNNIYYSKSHKNTTFPDLVRMHSRRAEAGGGASYKSNGC